MIKLLVFAPKRMEQIISFGGNAIGENNIKQRLLAVDHC
jgi:hypothetical protein